MRKDNPKTPIISHGRNIGDKKYPRMRERIILSIKLTSLMAIQHTSKIAKTIAVIKKSSQSFQTMLVVETLIEVGRRSDIR